MNKVDQRAFSSTNTGVAGYETAKIDTEKASELSQISSELEMELNINLSLINELIDSAQRLSPIKSETSGDPIKENSKPLSIVETLRRQIIDLRDLNILLSSISQHFNKVI